MRNFNRNKLIILFAVGSLMVSVLLSSCGSFPSNPSNQTPMGTSVSISHMETDYLPTESPADGLASKKVNLLTFEITVDSMEIQSLEVFGRVLLEGPPESKEHILHFRTDQIQQVSAMQLNNIDELRPGQIYQLVRPHFPTNEYSPYQGNQGRVAKVTIQEIRAYNTSGKQIPVDLK